MYVELDGAWHPIADDEHTACGLVIPHETLWTSEVPAVIHCGPDATVEAEPEAEPEAEEPEPVKVKAKRK